MKKSIVCILIVLILIFSLLPTVCFAEEKYQIDDHNFVLREVSEEEALQHKTPITGFDVSPKGEVIFVLSKYGVNNNCHVLIYDADLRFKKAFRFEEVVDYTVKWNGDNFLLFSSKMHYYEATPDGQIISLTNAVEYGSEPYILWNESSKTPNQVTSGTRTVVSENSSLISKSARDNRTKLTVVDGSTETVLYDINKEHKAKVIRNIIILPHAYGLGFLFIFFSVRKRQRGGR